MDTLALEWNCVKGPLGHRISPKVTMQRFIHRLSSSAPYMRSKEAISYSNRASDVSWILNYGVVPCYDSFSINV